MTRTLRTNSLLLLPLLAGLALGCKVEKSRLDQLMVERPMKRTTTATTTPRTPSRSIRTRLDPAAPARISTARTILGRKDTAPRSWSSTC